MKLKITLSQLLMLLLLVGIMSFSHAQKSISKVSGDLLTVGDKPSIQSKAAPNARIAGKQDLSALDQIQIFDGHIVIEAIAKSDPSTLLDELKTIGLQKGSYFGGMVSGLFPIDKIADLESMNALQFVRPAYKPMSNTGSVTSQGDFAQLSDVARTSFGVDGSGMRVGVLSDSWDNLGG